MTTISERLRTHIEEHNCAGGTWHETPDVCTEAADTIDALVAALHAAAEYVPEDARVTNDMIDAALALARKGGK